MEYLITFLEGIISFISPCMLPMLPVYLSYFAGENGAEEDEKPGKRRGFFAALMFVLGFTLVFCLMGLFAGTLGRFLMKYKTALNIVTGCIVIFLGLVFMNVIPLPFLRGIRTRWKVTGLFSAFVFGLIFSVSLTPCVGAFLGSALMLASQRASMWKGVLLLLAYSLGLGLPFLISAVLLERLKDTFGFIKRHYRVINIICGGFLIVVGILMATGQLSRLLSFLSAS
ncbi:MAG: sulfite exporter TauE/SafE family protein [Lachnospiraceae bacterium]|nr:sulfite exporter TauE/SafE family protein [Lachnospiraceae bacterium]